MAAPSPADGAATGLARRLRQLRQQHWPNRSLSQRVLGEALGVSLSLVSAWESESNPALPSPARLRDYATYFATERSSAGPSRLLRDDELTADERAARDELYETLLAARDEPSAQPAQSATTQSLWTFPEDEDIRIVCGKLDLSREEPHPYTQPDNLNYTELLTYADADALIELFGFLRKTNPDNDVRFIRSDRLKQNAGSADDTASHLVLLGGVGLNDLTKRVLDLIELPIIQTAHERFADQGEVFEVAEDGRRRLILPSVSEEGALLEDVGLLVRTPNPFNSHRSLTICNGVFSRGVLGAVRTLTDDKIRQQNERFLSTHFDTVDRFAILMRVPIVLGAAQTPDLQNPRTRLYEWRGDATPLSPSGLGRAG